MKDFDDQRKQGNKIPTFEANRFADLDLDQESWPNDEKPKTDNNHQ
jgi:AGCS family alanine or glycine:cation symporter